MRLNQSVCYGMACLLELSKTPHDYVDAHSLSTQQNIPLAYTHKVLQNLCRCGLVFSQKGLGYKLARSLSQITALEVVGALTKETESGVSTPDVGFILEQRINRALENFSLAEISALQKGGVPCA